MPQGDTISTKKLIFSSEARQQYPFFKFWVSVVPTVKGFNFILCRKFDLGSDKKLIQLVLTILAGI